MSGAKAFVVVTMVVCVSALVPYGVIQLVLPSQKVEFARYGNETAQFADGSTCNVDLAFDAETVCVSLVKNSWCNAHCYGSVSSGIAAITAASTFVLIAIVIMCVQDRGLSSVQVVENPRPNTIITSIANDVPNNKPVSLGYGEGGGATCVVVVVGP